MRASFTSADLPVFGFFPVPQPAHIATRTALTSDTSFTRPTIPPTLSANASIRDGLQTFRSPELVDFLARNMKPSIRRGRPRIDRGLQQHFFQVAGFQFVH